MTIRKTIWIAVIASATLLLVPALAEVLGTRDEAGTRIPLPAVEYGPALSASNPLLAQMEMRRMQALRRGAAHL